MKIDMNKMSTDELEKIRENISVELMERKKGPHRRCWVVRLNGRDVGATFFKKYEDAKKEFIQEADYTVRDMFNKFSIEPIDIPEGDYELRPDVWFGC